VASRDLDPVTRLTADAVGVPGERTFYLQAASGAEQVTLLVEKEQVRRLAESLQSWLPELAADRPEDPEEARDAERGERDRVVVVATEVAASDEEDPDPVEPDPREVRLWATRPQLRVLARHGSQVVQRGRPLCPLCGNPLDPTGHICPALNGHRPSA
jgi:hypothetical protein